MKLKLRMVGLGVMVVVDVADAPELPEPPELFDPDVDVEAEPDAAEVDAGVETDDEEVVLEVETEPFGVAAFLAGVAAAVRAVAELEAPPD